LTRFTNTPPRYPSIAATTRSTTMTLRSIRSVAFFGAIVCALTFTTAAFAQLSSNVQFKPGNYGTMVNGTIRGDEYIDYKLRAKAGQEMFVSLNVDGTNGNGTIYFNILPPGSKDVAIYNGSIDGRTTTVELPKSGEYRIRVYLMGNDRDTDKTVGYNIDLSIQ
jgi:hypothetical protein